MTATTARRKVYLIVVDSDEKYAKGIKRTLDVKIGQGDLDGDCESVAYGDLSDGIRLASCQPYSVIILGTAKNDNAQEIGKLIQRVQRGSHGAKLVIFAANADMITDRDGIDAIVSKPKPMDLVGPLTELIESFGAA